MPLNLITDPIHVKLENGTKGPAISTGYTRVVVGGRGAYLEIDPSQIIRDQLELQPGEEYRFTNEEWKKKVFYGWHRTKEGHRKVYEQFKYVGYADYKIGCFYIDPKEVFLPEGIVYG